MPGMTAPGGAGAQSLLDLMQQQPQTAAGGGGGPDPTAMGFYANYLGGGGPGMGGGGGYGGGGNYANAQPFAQVQGLMKAFPNIGQGSPLGGFYTLQDVFDRRAANQPLGPGMAGRAGSGGTWSPMSGTATPHQFQAGQDQPSTDNWMLLPPPYNQPGYIMRNGHIIDNSAANQGRGGFWAPGIQKMVSSYDDAGQLFERRPGSGAQFGFPALMPSGAGLAYAFWPGQVDPATILQENRG